MRIPVAVWGARFVRLWLDVVLPVWRLPGNLGAVKPRGGDELTVWCGAADRAVIEADAGFAALAAAWPVVFHVFDEDDGATAYERVARAHGAAVRRAVRDKQVHGGAAVWFLTPDAVFSDGTFAMAVEHLRAGRRAVVLPGMRGELEPIAAALQAAEQHGTLGEAASHRGLAGLALDHLHPISRGLLWDAALGSRWPSHLYFPVRGEGDELDGLVVRGFHQHPLVVWPQSPLSAVTDSVDGAFLETAVVDDADIVRLGDSDAGVALELSPPLQAPWAVDVPRDGRAAFVRAWAADAARGRQAWLASQSYRLHRGEVAGGAWARAEAEAARVVDEVF